MSTFKGNIVLNGIIKEYWSPPVVAESEPDELGPNIHLPLTSDFEEINTSITRGLTNVDNYTFLPDNGGLDFTGTQADFNRYIRYDSDITDFTASTDFTLSFTASLNSETYPAIISNGGSDHDGWRVYLNSGYRLVFIFYGTDVNADRLEVRYSIPNTTMRHYTITYEPSDVTTTAATALKLYVDGVETSQGIISNNFDKNTNVAPVTSSRFGLVDGSQSYKFTGTIKNVKVYTRVLSSEEITTLASTDNP